jgi:rRNA maturation endonuclease Nob1
MITECSNCKTGFSSPDFVHCPACGAKIEAPEKTVKVDDNPGGN